MAKTQTVDKKVLRKLKKLFTSRDNDFINQGHEVLRSLGDADICNYFLDGVKYTPQDDIGLIPNSMFTGTGPAQPYLNYALLGVIAYAPEDCEVAVSIRQSITTKLSIKLSTTRLLSEFKNLESLDLSGSVSIENLNVLIGCTKLTGLTFREASFTSLPEGLQKITKLTHLDLAGCRSLENVDGLVNLINLTNLNLYLCNIEKVEVLVSLTGLTYLNLDGVFSPILPKKDIMTSREEVMEYQEKIRFVMALRDEDTDVLSDYKDITKLDLYNCNSLENVDGLVNFSKLTSLKLSGYSLSVPPTENEMGTRKQVAEYQDKIRFVMALRDGNTNLINDYKDSTSIDLSGCDSLQNVDGLVNCTNLTDLNLSYCDSLQNVDGLTKCTKLTNLILSDCYSLQNVDGLANCIKLTNLNLNSCFELRNVDGLANCTNLTNLDLSHDIPNPFEVRGVEGVRLNRRQNRFYQKGGPIFQNVDGLANCTNLTNLKISNCDSLQNVNGIAGLVNLTSLDLSYCKSLRPKPSQNVMTARSQVEAYQVKVMKKTGMEIPESFGSAISSGKAKKTSIGRKTLANIKKFLKSRDYNHIDSGIELIRSMDDPSIYEVLLDACSICVIGTTELDYEEGTWTMVANNEVKFVRNSLFTGTVPAQPYLDYALLNLIAYAPEDCNLDESLKRSNIESLSFDLHELTELPSFFSNFSRLVILSLINCNFLQNLDALTNLTNLNELYVHANNFAVKPANEKMTTREQVAEYQDKIRFVMALRDGNTNLIKDYKDSISIDLSGCNSLKNVDYLSNFTNITSLDLGGCGSLQNVDGLESCTNLTELDLSGNGIQNVDKLANCTNLTDLNLNYCDSLQNLDGLANCTKITSLDLSDCDSLQNVDGLANCNNLTNLDLWGTNSLQNLDGLTNCTKITSLNLSACSSLQNVSGLVGCTGLNDLDLTTCKVSPKPTPVVMENRRQVALYQEKIKNFMK